MKAETRKVLPREAPPARVWTSLDLLKWTTGYFQKNGVASPRLEAELLLAEVLDCPRIRLYADFEKPVPAEKLARYREYVQRRGEAREPLQYILGHAQFVDLHLKVTPGVLIPRPETEILALWAVARAKGEGVAPASVPAGTPALPPAGTPALRGVRVLDLCTGSGCLALFIASKVAHAEVIATDIAAVALAVAQENARALGLAERVAFRQGDLFAALRPEEQASFDVVVANPPYVDPGCAGTLAPEVREHEPREALFAAEGGFAVVRRILENVGAWLRPGGWLGLELGLGQAEESARAARAAGVFRSVAIGADGARLPRYLHAQRDLTCAGVPGTCS
ncbi:MAG: peptide chain release factor N(5)-glutamine methyltransferase [Planctomycetota bacterium]